MAREPLRVLTESMFYVLLSLLRQERCGTEIVRYVDDATAGRVPLGPGTLYTILAKFQEEGLIREAAVEEILESAQENVRTFAALGGLVAPGTDAGAWAVPHGSLTEFSLLREALGSGTDAVLAAGLEEIRRKF